MPRLLTCLLFLALAGTALPGHARTWTDATGRYTIEADVVAFDDDHVVLQRDSDNSLGSVPLAKLSDADREFLQSKEAKLAATAWSDDPQVWTTRAGLQVPGRVIEFVRREVTFKRRGGKVYVNGKRFDNLPPIYQKVAPMVVAYFEQNSVEDEPSLERWLVHRKGQPQSYSVDGVILELENGDEYAVPFFLFSEEDLAVLQPGWEEWLAASEYDTKRDRSLELQSLAAAYQRDSQQKQQIARLQLGLQAVDTGLTSVWEVTLYPGPGVGGPPQWVVVPGRDSRNAQQNALAQYPGYNIGPVRRVSR